MEQGENQDHPSQTELLAAIFFLLLMALSYCHAWNHVKSMLILLCRAVSLIINQGPQQTLGQVAKKPHPVLKMHQLPAEINQFNFDCLILRQLSSPLFQDCSCQALNSLLTSWPWQDGGSSVSTLNTSGMSPEHLLCREVVSPGIPSAQQRFHSNATMLLTLSPEGHLNRSNV